MPATLDAMDDQARWPRGTPWHQRGPGPGRFRDESPDWASTVLGDAPMATLDRSAMVEGSPLWARALSHRFTQSRGHRPRQWEPVPAREHMAQRYAILAQAFMEDGMDERTAQREAGAMMMTIRPPRRVWRSGPHEVVIDTDTDLPEQQFLDYMDGLIGDYPPRGPLRLSIVPDQYLRGGLTLLDSETNELRPVVVLSDELFRPDYLAGEDMFRMQAIDDAEPWQYVLTHEWGHVFNRDESSEQSLDIRNGHIDALTRYAQMSAVEEAVADSFAEWVLSRGHTHNPAARAYQQHYRWRMPSGDSYT